MLLEALPASLRQGVAEANEVDDIRPPLLFAHRFAVLLDDATRDPRL